MECADWIKESCGIITRNRGGHQGWRQEKRRGGGREKEVPHSEYGGLVLGADGAFGVLGVHQPRGAALGLGVGLQLHRVHLGGGGDHNISIGQDRQDGYQGLCLYSGDKNNGNTENKNRTEST